MSGVVRFSVSIPTDLAEAFGRRIRALGYANRSEAVRDLMRDHLVEAEWEADGAEVVGTATIIYNHEKPDIQKALTQMQHAFHRTIVCTTHVHLDAHNCMEVVVLRGASADVKAIASALIAAKGVKHGKLVCTSVGRNLP
jgi:CopG family nickel-responsive transcriptional regulator